ncbi:sterol desaturase family protein [Vibrio sp. SM6]|uniref:Sterol desaturase family protein n=1 Tax=Vibrio agarilyticus TaxID=2726741 RepID=A0A7X8YGS2_9VIBR|nr:sterol desaturase family protein [Vibrio agarilyticus]NLS12652.1 sterol desaturase family protein [Vibrio agarilyticus]
MEDPTTIRLSVFGIVLLLCLAWELQAPRRPLTQGKSYRWLNNLSLVAIGALTVNVILPLAAFQAALIAQTHQWGLFNWPDGALNQAVPWVAVIIAVIVFDCAIYWQHRGFHRISWLWRLHRMHHADLDIDASTGLRFHPLEIVLSMLYKIALVFALGAPPISVVIFEVLLNACALFNHSNGYLDSAFDRKLRRFLVTPDMHRVHHSMHLNETHSNFGFCLSIWDRIFQSYCPTPKDGHDSMTIGLATFRDPQELRIDKLLTQPFRHSRTQDD